MEEKTEKKFAASLSILSNAVIITLKIAAGIISGSISIISEAIHSVSDFLASLLTFFAVTRSSEPADKEHPFGHGKYEDMSGFIEGGLIIFAGLYIIYEAVTKLFAGHFINHESMLGIYVMTFASAANLLVSGYLFKVSERFDSVSLRADAEHLRTDVFTSAGVLAGLILIKITGLVILDSLIALVVSVIILKTGFTISKTTLNNLLDVTLPDEDIEKIRKILENNSSIKGYKKIKARKAGKLKDIELTIFFNPDERIDYCHKICDEIENAIEASLGTVDVLIHAEPKE